MVLRRDDVDLGRDRDLVSRYQAGDPSAFDDLYVRYFDRLQRFCLRLTADRHEAEEAAQEAFVRAHRSMHSLHGDKRFYPWVTVIARRIIIDRHRKAARLELCEEVDSGSVGPDLDHLFDAIDHSLVRAAMAQVGPRHREVLQLREADGLSYAEIAAELDVPVTTVEALLHRARKALRREYAKVGGTARGVYGIPLAGWLASRAEGLRSRLSERWVELAAVAAPAAVAAATAAMVILPGGDAAVPPAASPRTPAAVEVMAETAPAAPVDDARSAEVPEPRVVPAPTTAAPTPAPPAPPTVTAGPVDVFTGPGGTDSAADEARDLPTNGEAGPATVGADALTAAADTIEYLLGSTDESDGTDAPIAQGVP